MNESFKNASDLSYLYKQDVVKLNEGNTTEDIDFSVYDAENFHVDKIRLAEVFGPIANKASLSMLEKAINKDIKYECDPYSVTETPSPIYIKKPDGDDTPQWIWDKYKNDGRTS